MARRRRAKSYNDVTGQYNRIVGNISSNNNLSNKEKRERYDRAQKVMSAYHDNLQRTDKGQSAEQKRTDAFKEIEKMESVKYRRQDKKDLDNLRGLHLIQQANKAAADFRNTKMSYSARAGISG